jgi:nucleolar protein 14
MDSVLPAGQGPAKKSPGEVASVTEGVDDYDQHVRELAFDKRARPKDRTKTEEELALEEKEALEKAERRRRRRMLGEDDDDSDEENHKTKGKRKRERGADDLEDDFYEESAEWNELGPGLGKESEVDKDDHSDESGGSAIGDADEEEDSGSENVSDDDDREDASVSGGEHEELVSTARVKDRKSKPKASNNELPYTFECPSSHREFLDIVEDVEDKDVPTVIQRIRTLYNPKLAPDNKFKLQVCLIPNLLYYFSADAEFPLDLDFHSHRSYSLHHVPAITSHRAPVFFTLSSICSHSLVSRSICRNICRETCFDAQEPKTWSVSRPSRC